MSDENITISVDDAEIDAAIAKLDEALEKTAQLTGQTPEEGQPYIIPSSEMAIIESGQIDTSDATAKLDDLEVKTEETKANVDEVFTEGEAKLTDLEAETETAKTSVDDVAVKSEDMDIKGLDSASHRIIRMIPGLREAQRIYRGLGALSEGSVMGVLGLLLVAYSIYRQIQSMLEEQQQQADEYKKAIMEARGFTTIAQFTAWQKNQGQPIEYRNRVIP